MIIMLIVFSPVIKLIFQGLHTKYQMSRFTACVEILGKRHLGSFDLLQSDVQWIHTFHMLQKATFKSMENM